MIEISSTHVQNVVYNILPEDATKIYRDLGLSPRYQINQAHKLVP